MYRGFGRNFRRFATEAKSNWSDVKTRLVKANRPLLFCMSAAATLTVAGITYQLYGSCLAHLILLRVVCTCHNFVSLLRSFVGFLYLCGCLPRDNRHGGFFPDVSLCLAYVAANPSPDFQPLNKIGSVLSRLRQSEPETVSEGLDSLNDCFYIEKRVFSGSVGTLSPFFNFAYSGLTVLRYSYSCERVCDTVTRT
jgi:hypothetical protein